MSRITVMLLLSILLLPACTGIAVAQSKTKNRTGTSGAKPATKPVTITLVRWPYT